MKSPHTFHIRWLFILLYTITGNESLKNVKLIADEIIRVNDSLRLECEYDLESAQLYSIKWYLGTDEFYRYVPKESPPTRVFPVSGLNVDLSKSDQRVVVLHNLPRNRTGYYRCEVTADAPSFHTDIKTSLVIIAQCPEEPPDIKTEKLKFDETDMIKATCTSLKSFPPANLTWFIHGVEVQEDEFLKVNLTLFDDGDESEDETLSELSTLVPVPNSTTSILESISIKSIEDETKPASTKSILEIRNLSTSGVFVEGKLRLKCEATVYSIYKESTEVEIADDTPQLAHVLSPTPSFARCSCISSEILVITSCSLGALLLGR